MSTGTDVDQIEWQRTARAFFAAKSTEQDIRALTVIPEGYDRDVWAQMSEQLGLQAMTIAEENGGFGFGVEEVGVALHEMGRTLYCGPFLASAVLGATLLESSTDEAIKTELLPGIADGSKIATVAVAEGGGAWTRESIATTAREHRGGWALSGRKSFVVDGQNADLILVAARTDDDRIGVFVVDAEADGLTRTALHTLDQTRRLAALELADTPARRIESDDAWALVQAAQDAGSYALAAELVGVGEVALEMAVEYAADRVQYGRPIGSFQVTKHKCANMLVDVETSRAAVWSAGKALANDRADASASASAAKAHCGEAIYRVTAENIQIHGGIGVTWEHQAHYYFKRARANGFLLGDSRHHRLLVARHLDLAAAA